MRPVTPLSVAAATALLAGTVVVAPPAAAAPADGPATITLPACAQSSPVSEAPVAQCSYLALPRTAGGAYYAHPSAGGEVRLTGSLTAGQLSLPPSGQVWPGLPVAGGLATVEVTRTEITGSVSPTGEVTLSVPFEASVDAGPFGTCTARSTATLSSAATDPVGGAQGSPLDPVTGEFAVAGSSPAPILTGALCASAGDLLDLSRETGWYLRGSLRTTPAATTAQTVSVELPARIKRKGRTVLLAGPAVTNAGQPASPRVTWGRTRAANGGKPSQARVSYANDRVVVRTFGTARKIFVRLTLTAPAVAGFTALDRSRVWAVR